MGAEPAAEIGIEDIVYDDSDLLADRLLRSLHRGKDGHLASAHNVHKAGVADEHNVAVLYCYTFDDGLYTLHHHYVHSETPLTYKKWSDLALSEAKRLHRNSGPNFQGVYGWITSRVQITPLHTGDIFIKIDEEGARGVRLSFSSRKAGNEARKKAQRRTR